MKYVYGVFHQSNLARMLTPDSGEGDRVERWRTLTEAREEFQTRATTGRGTTAYVIGESGDDIHWPDLTDGEVLMTVWIREDNQPIPYAHSACDEHWTLGPRGGVHRAALL